MAVIVSLINMKGGVGKTTIAAELCHVASSLGFRSLAVDLDPQANLSQVLLGQHGYLRLLQEDRPTIDHVVRRFLPPSQKRGSPARCEIGDAIMEHVGRRDSRLDLLPSQLELASTMKWSQVDPQSLARAIVNVADRYELILIDCAPTESILTETAYHASRFLLVPVKPEYLATIGLPLLAKSVREFKAVNRRHALEVVGIVINHATYRSHKNRGVDQSVAEIRAEAKENSWPVFENEIPYSHSWPKAARDGTPIGRTKSVREKVMRQTAGFSAEFLRAVKVMG
jgi:chromosome partitioning protein